MKYVLHNYLNLMLHQLDYTFQQMNYFIWWENIDY